MPTSKDLAALPTSWALTLWDAAPLYLSIEAAFAILVIVLLSGRWRRAIWRGRQLASPGGAAVLAMTGASLSALYVAGAVVALWLTCRAQPPDAHEDRSNRRNPPAPSSPGQALRDHLGESIFPLLLAAAIAALIKVILVPSLVLPDWAWAALAIPLGATVPGGPGPASIIATTLWQSAGGPAAAIAAIASGTISTAHRLYPARGRDSVRAGRTTV